MSGNPYAAWADWLAAFGRGEDRPATHLAAVADDMGPNMQARVLHRLNEAFVARQELWSKALQRDLDTLPSALATNLIQARARLRPLVELTRSELLPEPVRAVLREALADAVRSTQDSLVDSVRRENTLLAIVRDNDLTAALTAPSRVDGPETRPSGRTIIWR
jgi:hypothetical protein